MNHPQTDPFAVNPEHIFEFISKKLLDELTGADPHVLERCLVCAQARQRALYQSLGITTYRQDAVDEEIGVLMAIAWLYQYNGDHNTDALYYEKACILLENSYGVSRKQASHMGLCAVHPGSERNANSRIVQK